MPDRRGGVSLPHRAFSLMLAAGATLLMVLALIFLGDRPLEPPRFKGRPLVLDLIPDPEPTANAERSKTQSKPRPREETPSPPVRQPPPIEPPPLPDDKPLPFIVLSREDYAAADIAGLGTRGSGQRQGEQIASAATDSEMVGAAPNGEPLYAAEWYRRPTRAELSGYLPSAMPKEGWGLIACRTAARYRVEDCVELGSAPRGSRLAGAVRQAAWQFLVRPPRVGGKELVGTWVRIRIDYTSAAEE